MLDTTFAALADPTRRNILNLLADKDLSVGEVVDKFDIAQSAISRHLKVLEDAQLIQRRRDGQRRICSLHAHPLIEIDAWMKVYRPFWESALKRMDKVITQKKTRKN